MVEPRLPHQSMAMGPHTDLIDGSRCAEREPSSGCGWHHAAIIEVAIYKNRTSRLPHEKLAPAYDGPHFAGIEQGYRTDLRPEAIARA